MHVGIWAVSSRWAPGTRAATTGKGFYVEVRYPRGHRWVSVGVSDSRAAAARLAGEAYRWLANDDGETPHQVRIVSVAQLRRDGGAAAVDHAAADMWERARSGSEKHGDPAAELGAR